MGDCEIQQFFNESLLVEVKRKGMGKTVGGASWRRTLRLVLKLGGLLIPKDWSIVELALF